MRLPESLTGLLHRQRPVLRVQLALLYSGVFVGLVVVLFLASSVLFGTANVFFGHSQMAFHPGAAAAARQSAAGPRRSPPGRSCSRWRRSPSQCWPPGGWRGGSCGRCGR